MKRYIAAMLLFTIVLASSIGSAFYTTNVIDKILTLLQEEVELISSKMPSSGESLDAAYKIWEKNYLYFGSIIPQDKLFAVTEQFASCRGMLIEYDNAETLAELLQLEIKINIVKSIDLPTLHNIL